jgi:predicted RNase H-like HicB family nuclease
MHLFLESLIRGWNTMERIINIHIEKLPEGVYLATSQEVPGLVAQGRTATETLEIARDVARKLIEAHRERSGDPELSSIGDSFDYPLIVNS